MGKILTNRVRLYKGFMVLNTSFSAGVQIFLGCKRQDYLSSYRDPFCIGYVFARNFFIYRLPLLQLRAMA